jgi:hypothetical protein
MDQVAPFHTSASVFCVPVLPLLFSPTVMQVDEEPHETDSSSPPYPDGRRGVDAGVHAEPDPLRMSGKPLFDWNKVPTATHAPDVGHATPNSWAELAPSGRAGVDAVHDEPLQVSTSRSSPADVEVA